MKNRLTQLKKCDTVKDKRTRKFAENKLLSDTINNLLTDDDLFSSRYEQKIDEIYGKVVNNEELSQIAMSVKSQKERVGIDN